jgi:hypothetical protein
LIKFLSNQIKNLTYCSWNNSSLFKIIFKTKHRKCFSCSSLSIREYGAIVSINNILNNLNTCKIVNIILSSILHNCIKFKFPCIELIIHSPLILFINSNLNFAGVWIYFQIIWWKLISWPCSDKNLNCLFMRHYELRKFTIILLKNIWIIYNLVLK